MNDLIERINIYMGVDDGTVREVMPSYSVRVPVSFLDECRLEIERLEEVESRMYVPTDYEKDLLERIDDEIGNSTKQQYNELLRTLNDCKHVILARIGITPKSQEYVPMSHNEKMELSKHMFRSDSQTAVVDATEAEVIKRYQAQMKENV